MRTHNWVSAVAAVVLLGVSPGCGPDSPDNEGTNGTGPTLAIDETKGSLEGVGLGASATAVKRVFGEPVPARTEPRGYVYPTELDIGDPTFPQTAGRTPPGKIETLRYSGQSFITVDSRVLKLIVSSDRGLTRRGLQPGDPIAQAESLYPELECGQTDVGNESEDFEPACWGAMSKKAYIWIGGDPINNIQLSAQRLQPSP